MIAFAFALAPGCVQSIVVSDIDATARRPDARLASDATGVDALPGAEPRDIDGGAPLDAGPTPPNPLLWTALPLPPALSSATAVWGRSATEVYVIDDAGQVFRFDGRNWQLFLRVPGGAPLYAMWGTDDHLFVAAQHAFHIIDRFAEFRVFSIPGSLGVHGVDGVDDADAYIVGTSTGGATLARFGNSWVFTVQRWPSVASLRAVAVRPDGTLLLGGTDLKLFESTLDGFRISELNWSPRFPQVRVPIEDIEPHGDEWVAVGGDGLVLRRGASQAWAPVHLEVGSGPLRAVTAMPDTNPVEAYAVGTSTATSPILRGLGDEWSRTAADQAWVLRDVWAADKDTAFAVGQRRGTSTPLVIIGRRP